MTCTRLFHNLWKLSNSGRLKAAMSDDDDWVGTPPEGRYTRDRAKPEFWAGQRPLMIGGAVLALLVIVLLLVALLS